MTYNARVFACSKTKTFGPMVKGMQKMCKDLLLVLIILFVLIFAFGLSRTVSLV